MITLFKHLILFTLLSVSVHANAGLLLADVGGVDSFVERSSLSNSGDGTEEAWVEGILGFDVSYDETYSSSGGDWALVGDAGIDDIFYLELKDSPQYFLIKLGDGGAGENNGNNKKDKSDNGDIVLDSHYLFKNSGMLNYAVIDFSEAGIDFTVQNISINRMSHVGEFGTVDNFKIPEPNALILLSLAISIIGLRRKIYR